MQRRLAFLLISTLSAGCGAAGAAKGPQAPTRAGGVAEHSDTAATEPPPVLGLGALPEGVAAAPKECAQYGLPPAGDCRTNADFMTRLADALDLKEVARDRALGCLESDAAASPGLMRALRAQLAPRGCADALVTSAEPPAGAERDVADTLVALAVGARLFRSVREPPLPRPPFSKVEFVKHFNEVLKPWVASQAHAVDELSKVGPRLTGYARGILALEAGLADLRFVSLARAIELPEEMKQDPEISETYLVALERALEPRVARGRDAALVGLGELSRQGVINDPRLTDARKLLSELYAGRRLDALDRLLLPPLPPLVQDTPLLRVAAQLPAFFALDLLPSLELVDAQLLRARLEQGVPPALWLSGTPASKSPELRALSAHALFRLGQLYFWSEPFVQAARISPDPAEPASVLLQALARVLARGPRNAASMMLGSPHMPTELRNTADLDDLAKLKGPLAGMAEFDAAVLRSLAPPPNAPGFWKEQAERYQRAQKKLEAPLERAAAAELAKAAKDTEQALRLEAKR